VIAVSGDYDDPGEWIGSRDGVYGRIVFGSAGGDISTLKQKGGSLEDFL
jgi:hypothetical protein